MKAVFDTNILIDYLNGVEDALRECGLYEAKVISIITYIEVLVGVKGTQHENSVRKFLSSFEKKELTAEVAEKAIELRKGLGMKLPDALIYATARTETCMFVTRNTKDFKEDLPDVRVPYLL